MPEKKHLYLLWTNADPITADKMVFMYTINSLLQAGGKKLPWWSGVLQLSW